MLIFDLCIKYVYRLTPLRVVLSVNKYYLASVEIKIKVISLRSTITLNKCETLKKIGLNKICLAITTIGYAIHLNAVFCYI